MACVVHDSKYTVFNVIIFKFIVNLALYLFFCENSEILSSKGFYLLHCALISVFVTCNRIVFMKSTSTLDLVHFFFFTKEHPNNRLLFCHMFWMSYHLIDNSYFVICFSDFCTFNFCDAKNVVRLWSPIDVHGFFFSTLRFPILHWYTMETKLLWSVFDPTSYILYNTNDFCWFQEFFAVIMCCFITEKHHQELVYVNF